MHNDNDLALTGIERLTTYKSSSGTPLYLNVTDVRRVLQQVRSSWCQSSPFAPFDTGAFVTHGDHRMSQNEFLFIWMQGMHHRRK